MFKRYLLTPFILTLAVITVVSGCFKKEVKPVPEDNIKEPPIATTTENQKEKASTTEEIDTKDWKIYRNEEYGFEIRYPAGWILNKDNNKISIYYPHIRENIPEGGGGIDIVVNKNNLEEFIKQYNITDDFSKIIDQKNYTLNNVLGFKLTGTTALGINNNFIFAKNGSYSYIISFHDFDKDHLNIISTFKFTSKN